MDKTSFREAILADYIMEAESWPRKKLIQELIRIKFHELESATDNEVLVKLYEQRTRQD